MKRTSCLHSYQRGSWAPGSKHQKHVSMNPTTYLYRFAGPHGPGPYTMKYWWTLGCFPTGMETPFRLNEFLATYKREHVPLEVEEWLAFFVQDPYADLDQSVTELIAALEEFPDPNDCVECHSMAPSSSTFLKPLKKFECCLGISVSPVGVRSALSSFKHREKVLGFLHDYKESLSEGGSTPHRRAAKDSLNQLSQNTTEDNNITTSRTKIQPISSEITSSINAIISPPQSTAPDERNLIQLLTTFADACVASGRHEHAFSILSDTLKLSHDDDTLASQHANVATAALLCGQYGDAEYHARESALLQPAPARNTQKASRGYALWATAAVYQQKLQLADNIVTDALQSFPDDVELKELKEDIDNMKVSRSVSPRVPSKRMHLKSQQRVGLENGSGKTFDNEFDWIQFKNKLYPSKMNPSNNELGSVFRRVGDLGGAISTSRSSERL